MLIIVFCQLAILLHVNVAQKNMTFKSVFLNQKKEKINGVP